MNLNFLVLTNTEVLLSTLVTWLFYQQAKRSRIQAGGGGVCDPNFFLQISFSLVKMSFHVESHPPGLPGTGPKFWVVGGGGGVG